MKRIMLIGDSIRMGYQEQLRQMLGSGYEVWAPEENARFAKYTLNCLPEWFTAFPSPDLVHWNNGLWDTATVCAEDGAFTPVEEYVRYLSIISRELLKNARHVIFATTTPVQPGSANQVPERIPIYNAAAEALMREKHIEVNDLYHAVLPHVGAWICDDHIHLTDAGKAGCAAQIAEVIRQRTEG